MALRMNSERWRDRPGATRSIRSAVSSSSSMRTDFIYFSIYQSISIIMHPPSLPNSSRRVSCHGCIRSLPTVAIGSLRTRCLRRHPIWHSGAEAARLDSMSAPADRQLTPDPDPVTEYYKKDVDRTLLREHLKLTPQQRIERLVAFMQSLERLRAARRGQ